MEPFAKDLAGNYLGVLKKYFVFKGRAGRKEFWYFVLANVIIWIPFWILGLIPFLGRLFDIVYWLFRLAILIPTITVTVRRLQDTDKSGWMLLILAGASGLLSIFAALSAFSFNLFLMSFLIILAIVPGVILLVFTILEGTKGDNKYGPVPSSYRALNDWSEMKEVKDIFKGQQDGSSNAAAGAAAEGEAKAKTPSKAKTVFCGECGAKNEKGTKFCGSCGKPIE